MKLTDYKFWYILRYDDIHISEAAVRFYEGEITTEDEKESLTGTIKPVTRYRRFLRLQERDLNHLGNKRYRKEANGNDAVIYTPNDFGRISTDEELRSFLNKEIKKDKKRSHIKEQE